MIHYMNNFDILNPPSYLHMLQHYKRDRKAARQIVLNIFNEVVQQLYEDSDSEDSLDGLSKVKVRKDNMQLRKVYEEELAPVIMSSIMNKLEENRNEVGSILREVYGKVETKVVEMEAERKFSDLVLVVIVYAGGFLQGRQWQGRCVCTRSPRRIVHAKEFETEWVGIRRDGSFVLGNV